MGSFTRNFTVLIFLLLGILHTNIYAQKLSRTEKRILKTVSKNNADALAFLERVVNINSGTMNHRGIRENGRVMALEFEKIGFNTRWIDMPSEMNRAGHLFVEKKGSKGKRLLLIGHLDTVFEEDSDFQQFAKVSDSIARGPGANDMKGGNVIILYALKALYDRKLLKNAQVIVAFTGDEESTGKPISGSRKDLIEAAKRSDIALGFENSSGFNFATVARRGSSGWKVEVKGRRAHSSGIFHNEIGAGAVFEISRILHAFYEEVRGEEFLTFNPGILLGGTTVNFDEANSKGDAFGKSNVVAQTAVVEGGLRFITEEQKNTAREKMREIVGKNLPKTTATISFIDSYPAMPPTEGNYELLKKLDRVSKDLGQGGVKAYNPLYRGAADVSFVAKYVSCLDGLGAMGSGAHTPHETVNLKTFESLTQRAAVLIYRLIRE